MWKQNKISVYQDHCAPISWAQYSGHEGVGQTRLLRCREYVPPGRLDLDMSLARSEYNIIFTLYANGGEENVSTGCLLCAIRYVYQAAYQIPIYRYTCFYLCMMYVDNVKRRQRQRQSTIDLGFEHVGISAGTMVGISMYV